MILKHILRNIKGNKIRSMIIIFSLMISTMVIFINFVIKDDISGKYESILRGKYQTFDFSISNDSSEVESYFKTDTLDFSNLKIDKVLYINNTYGVMDLEEEAINIVFYGVDRQALIDSKLCILEENNNFNVLDEEEIIIGSNIAEKYDLKINEKIKFDTKYGEKEFKVGAIALNEGLYINSDNDFLVILPKSYMDKMMQYEGQADIALVDLEEESDVPEAINIFKNNNEDFLVNKLVNEEDINYILGMIQQILLLIIIAVIILNYYVISSTTKMILSTRIPVVGTFRSSGATKKRVGFILVLENVLYGFIGGILGVGAGILLRDSIVTLFLENSDKIFSSSNQSSLNLKYVMYAIAFGVILQLLIVIKYIFEMSRMPIKDTIFNKPNIATKIKTSSLIIGILLIVISIILYFINSSYNVVFSALALLMAISGAVCLIPILIKYIIKILAFVNRKLFGGAAEIGTKNVSYSKMVSSNVRLLTVALSMILIIYMMSLSLKGVFDGAKDVFESDIQISNISMKSEDFDFLYDVENVDNVDATYNYQGYFTFNGVERNLVVAGLNKSKLGIKDNDDEISKLKNNEALIDEYYAKRNGINVGDTLKLESEGIKEEKFSVTIVGYVDTTMFTLVRNVLVLNEEEYIKKIKENPTTLNISTSDNLDDMKSKLLKELAGYNTNIQTVDEYLKMQSNQTQGIVTLVWLLLAFSIIMAILGIMNNQIIGFIQRKKEYAVLYSVAMSKGQLKVMILFETLMTFFVGCLLGGLLSFWLKELLENLMYSIGIFLSINIQVYSLLGMIAIVFLVLGITSIFPVKRMSRINIIAEIKCD